MLIYSISYFFYIDGVHTIISMSTSYGTNLGLDSAGMLLALLPKAVFRSEQCMGAALLYWMNRLPPAEFA